jgi:hypothetical protein
MSFSNAGGFNTGPTPPRRVDPGTHGITSAWPNEGDPGRLTWDDPENTPAPTGPATSDDQSSR